MDVRLRITALLAVSTLALGACGEDDDPVVEDPTPAGSSSSSTPEPSGSTSPTTPPSAQPSEPTETTESGSTSIVPVYFAGETPQGVRLFREFRTVQGDPLTEAAALVTTGEALDPDYRSLFPAGTSASVSAEDDAIVVRLADDAWSAPGGLSKKEARLATQQLVYTLQGVQQERLPVRVVDAEGQPAPLFGLTGDLTAAPQLDVMALVNITEPAEGASVSGSFTADGVASSFEATVPWQVRDSAGKVVAKGFSTADGWMDKLYPWQTEVDVSKLAPGTYTFVAMTDDPSGGEGGGPTEDTRTIVVE